MHAGTPTEQAYSELQDAFDHYNVRLFDGQLPHCLITMQRKSRTAGYFSSDRFVHRLNKTMTDEIAMNPAYFAVVPVIEVLQTLVHEMVHAWQHHLGKPSRRSYHNTEWAEKMEAIGLMPSDTGKPGGARTGEKMQDYPIEEGQFLKATEELLAGNFGISWLDRFPQRAASGHGDATNSEAAGLDGSLEAMLAPPKPSNGSNRTKFRCGSCGAQAWGKPSLRILCGNDTCGPLPLEPIV